MPFHTQARLRVRLTPRRRAQVMSVLPEGTTILSARYFDNYDLPCPVRVEIALPDGARRSLVLRSCRHGDTEREAELLRALHRIGLPVPRVLAEFPATSRGGDAATLLTCLPGESLQSIACGSPEGLETAQALLIEAADRLAGLTRALEAEPAARSLPRRALSSELDDLAASRSAWASHPLWRQALSRLEPVLRSITAPLVFSNGDYQPGNFLAVDGRLTGFLDFESACFEDPLIGFAKFPIYDIHPLNKAGFIGRMLATKGWSHGDFAPRLALRCLRTLAAEIPPEGGDSPYREHVLGLLESSTRG